MTSPTAVPFVVRRENGVVRGFSVMATRDVSHGLLRLDAGRVVAQWSTARETSRAGWEIRVDHEQGPVHEVELPLGGLAGARVRWRLLPWPPRWQLVIRAADLRLFESLAGELRLPLSHPAALVLAHRPSDRAVLVAEREGRPVLAEAPPPLSGDRTSMARPVPRWRAG